MQTINENNLQLIELKRLISQIQIDAGFDKIDPVANHIGVTVSRLYNIMAGKIKNFDKEFEQLKEIANKYENRLQSLVSDDNSKSIPLHDTEVFATISPAMADVVTMRPESFIKIPMFSQGEHAVKVSGNSMHPFIRHGDWIVIKEIVNRDFIIYGECYLVITKSDNFKTVAFINEIQEDQSILYLSKYNTEQFAGQRIPKEEILKLYKVIGRFGDINL